jgi:(2Fe-2S) ferredoxin
VSARDRPPRCADAAEERGDPRAGSAVPVDRWLLVEQPGPWGRDALSSSRLAPAVAAELARRAAATGTRVLLVRRHGRAGHSPAGRRHWGVAVTGPGAPGLRWGRYAADEELLDLPLEGPLPARRGDAPPHDPTTPVYLVCAHGRHDTCCAVRGRAVAAALQDLAPGRVWECSHVGGCRFAANLVVLPHGLYYGGVTPASAAAVVEATDHGHVVPDLLRGRSSQPAAVQAAEHHARAYLGRDATRLDAVRARATRELADGTVAVDVEDAATGRVLALTVRRGPAGPPARLTCAATRPAVPQGWDLVALDER